jgi:polynucleotide 5'-kinase involved in rRNA processing
MNDAIGLSLILLACITPVLAIIIVKQTMDYRTRKMEIETKLRHEYDQSAFRDVEMEVARLRERVAVLEAIVTDKGYELTEKIKVLGKEAPKH